MGGMQEGNKAAEIAITVVERYAKGVLPGLPSCQEALRSSIGAMYQEANRNIWDYGQTHGASGMGTTLVICLAFDGRYLVANAGDSRCYYVNNCEVRQLTEDHSRVQELVRMGSMTPDAARRSPYRNQLTNSLGESQDIQVDILPADLKYGIIDEDCVLLLCSDGLHGEIMPEDLFAHLHGTRELESGCENLVSLAFERGSTDNITIAAVEFGELAREHRKIRRLPGVDTLLRRQAGVSRLEPNPSRKLLLVVLALIGLLICTGAYILIGGPRVRAIAKRLLVRKGTTGNGPKGTTKSARAPK
jgi:protein phosphatase